MRKIPTLYQRDPATKLKYMMDEVHPDCDWVIAGEGRATMKWDGTAVMVDETGDLWKRREVKAGATEPAQFLQIGEADPNTGKRVGWVPCDRSDKGDKWHFQAVDNWHRGDASPGRRSLRGPMSWWVPRCRATPTSSANTSWSFTARSGLRACPPPLCPLWLRTSTMPGSCHRGSRAWCGTTRTGEWPRSRSGTSPSPDSYSGGSEGPPHQARGGVVAKGGLLRLTLDTPSRVCYGMGMEARHAHNAEAKARRAVELIEEILIPKSGSTPTATA